MMCLITAYNGWSDLYEEVSFLNNRSSTDYYGL
jgi:hypothetical protein